MPATLEHNGNNSGIPIQMRTVLKSFPKTNTEQLLSWM